MPFTEKDTKVARAVIDWLNSVAERAGAEEAESLLAASQCVQSAFGLSEGGAGVDLEALVAGARTPEEEQFESFLAILRGKGFFAGVAEGTPEYSARMQLARDNFAKLHAQQTAPAPVEVSKEAEARGEALKAEGNEALKAGDAARAAELYAEASRCNPQNAVYHSNRAAALMQLGRDEEAVRECEAAVALNPAYARSYSRLGAALHKLGRYQEALDRGYSKALELDPANATVQENKAACERDLRAASAAAAAPAPAAPAAPAGAAPSGAAPPMEGLAQMMQDPAFQEKAKNLAQQLGLSKEGDGSEGGAPGLDMSKMSEMLSNPAIQQMAQNIASNPQMMSNLANMFSSLIGGANAPQ